MSVFNLGGKAGHALFATMLFALSPVQVHADADAAIARGQAAAAVCVACHQADGNGMESVSSWPRLAGLSPVYLANQLHAFKSGARTNAEMKPFADMLNDQQIADVAAYYASLPAKGPDADPDVDPAVLEAGRKLALHGDWDRYIVPCISCHGPGNQGVGHAFPDIAGQHAGYIASQLRAWRDGERQGDPLDLMKAIATRMTDADIDAVSAWLSTQPPADALSDGPTLAAGTQDDGAKQ
ncbi:MAG TPA: c-type cytochrome [Burkholderiaceae bacterium]|nr:c-type cytochrome [Burkholderiaceae bacterium]